MQPHDIEFQNLTFTVSASKGKKKVLKGVSGAFKSGELTALMGPSGAGKSSLMNILTGFQCNGMEGIVKKNGQVRTRSGRFKKDSCYILQDDQLNPLFTVEEIMSMAADLKLGPGAIENKQEIIDKILDALSLSAHLDTYCGRLSGGQKKRLSIALELIDNPPVIFLDEPTTGLDSSSALQCISILKSLAKEGRTIICTIHQPSASVYEMFDHVYVIAEGQCVYQGDASNTVEYLSSCGFKCPHTYNPADYLIEVASGDYGEFMPTLTKAASNPIWRTIKKQSNKEQKMINLPSAQFVEPPSELSRFVTLLKRTCLHLYRDWTITHLKLVVHFCVGIFLGIMFRNFGSDGSKTIQNLGYLLISLVYLVYTALMPGVLKFPSELPILRKERFNNWYKLKTYYAAYIAVSIPIQILFSLAYTGVSYILTDQPMEFSRYLMFLTTIILVTLSAESLGILLGTTVNPINGTFLGAISLAVMLAVGGFLIFYSHMKAPLNWLTYISYISFGFEGLVQSIYDDRGHLKCPDDILYCHYRIPDTLLQEIGIQRGQFWKDIILLSINFVGLKIAGFLLLRKKLSSG